MSIELNKAIKIGDFNKVTQILSDIDELNVNKLGNDGSSPIHFAATVGNE